MAHQLENKRALVTGGSRGIGAAIVKRLAREGAHVALTYVSKPDQANETVTAARALGVRALAIQADSADAAAVVLAVERTVAELGGIDILVNSAGIAVMAPHGRLSPRGPRSHAGGERARRVRRHASRRQAHEDGRPDHHDWQLQRRSHAVRGRRGVRHEQGRARGPRQGTGARPRPARHHRRTIFSRGRSTPT